MEDCLFCKIIAGEIPSRSVRSTERIYAFHDIAPQAPTHILVVPREHYENAAALAAGDPQLFSDVAAQAAEIAAQEGIAGSGYRMAFNTGLDAGQTVFHVHAHLLGGKPLGGMVGGRPPVRAV